MHLLGSGFAQSTAIGTSQDIESHMVSNVKIPKDKDIFC